MPASARDLTRLHKQLDEVAQQFDGRAIDKRLMRLALMAKGDADEVVATDVGADYAMSNWRRNKPIPIHVRYDLTGPHQVTVHPTPRSKGPWRVLEEGRQASYRGQVFFYTAKNGKTRHRYSKGASASPAKHTWTKAVVLMSMRAQRRGGPEWLGPVRKIFGRGVL